MNLMARKRRKEKYAGKTREEWRNWGEEFGKNISNFSEEMEGLGKRFGRRMEKKRWDRECRYWWFSTFGFIGPLIGSIIGIIFLLFGIWMLNLINTPFGSGFISTISNFFFYNLHWFFGASVLFGYNDYLRKKFSRSYWLFSPIVGGIEALFVIWIIISILVIVGEFTGVLLFSMLSSFFYTSLLGIFMLFVLIGYIEEIIKNIFRCCCD